LAALRAEARHQARRAVALAAAMPPGICRARNCCGALGAEGMLAKAGETQ
jgi:hypothetical protein